MDLYLHVRVLFGMIVGLAVAHLLQGVARFVQHPRQLKVYWVHLTWVLFLFLYIIHFWWWEFSLLTVRQWNFPLYLFIALYAVIIYLACVLIMPVEIDEYTGFRDYFYSRHHWFFAVMTVMFVIDFVDTLVKGRDYYHRHAISYCLRTGISVALGLIAIRVKNPRFHAFFAVFAVLYEVGFIFLLYRTLA